MSEAAKSSSSVGRVFAWGLVLVLAVSTGVVMWQSGWFERPMRVALVTASTDAYWDDVIKGAQSAAKLHNVELTIHAPETATREEQTEIVSDLLEQDIEGIAISPIDPSIQAPLLNEAADGAHLVTFDSDSPVAGRLCFVGADNYEAGRRCGELVRNALPDGGKVAIVIGTLEKENGHRRRQGVIDELLDRPYYPGRDTEPVEGEHAGDDFTIVATLIDKDDPNEALVNVRALLEEHDDVQVLIGLYGYHAPVLVKAAKEADRLSGIKIVGFDYHADTLAAIEAGEVYATLAQDSYNYGFTAIRVLVEVSRGRGMMSIPLYEKIHYPLEVVTQNNVEDFRQRLSSRGQSVTEAS